MGDLKISVWIKEWNNDLDYVIVCSNVVMCENARVYEP